MELLEKMKSMLLRLALLFATTSAFNLTCHCLDGAQCHTNGYCETGCEKGWFGPGCQVGNVALGKTAIQSSTYYDYGYIHTAGLAVDGYMSGSNAYYCSHTDVRPVVSAAWWYVVLDMAKYYVITNITIVNRPDRSKVRLTNFKILYSNDTEGDPDPSNSSWHECVEEKGAVGFQKTYTCQNKAIAKRVAVYLTRDMTNNPMSILTLCEVLIYGYQQYVCPSGYTGPGCLLRSCNDCESNMGQCSGDYGSCSYSICPHRSLLPPQCWISLSDYSEVDIRTTATCNKLLYSFDIPEAQPNIPASLLQVEVSTSDGLVVVNATTPVQNFNSSTFNYSNAVADASYNVSVKPLYCEILNMPCFYATSSKIFRASTGKREYVFSHNFSCIFVNVTSDIPDCEQPTKFQVTCQSDIVDGDAVNSSTSSVCGLERGREYSCSLEAVINAFMIERANARIVTDLHSSRGPENDSLVLAGSIGGSIATLLLIVAVVVFVYCRRQRQAKPPTLVTSEDANVKRHLPADTRDKTKLPSSHKEHGESPYESLNMELVSQSTGDYASLNYTT